MDLGAYMHIEDLSFLLEVCDINISRLRGLRLMRFEQQVTDEELDEMIQDEKTRKVKDWLQQHSWNVWSSENAKKNHPAFVWGYNKYDVYNEHLEVVGYDFSKVHGNDRRVLENAFKETEKNYKTQYELFNRFAGKDVLYVHARQGGENRERCKTNDLRLHKRYLADCDDAFDSTYCDLYFDISDINIYNYCTPQLKMRYTED